MLLTDLMQAIHFGTAPVYSTAELYIKMPSSDHQFRDMYHALLYGSKPLPEDTKNREDALLLLTALLNDIVYTQTCLFNTPLLSENRDDTTGLGTDDNTLSQNPFSPLSSQTEFSRLNAALQSSLDRWDHHFQPHVGREIMALYYFSKLQLICPDIWQLPRLAGYGPNSDSNGRSSSRHVGSHGPRIPDKALHLAWLVLDTCDTGTEGSETSLAIWLPVVLFLCALVVWQKLRHRSPTDLKYGSFKVLGMFRDEIDQLPWPCCVEMATVLNRIMKA